MRRDARGQGSPLCCQVGGPLGSPRESSGRAEKVMCGRGLDDTGARGGPGDGQRSDGAPVAGRPATP
ncbi:hypothetical protein NDU88_005855 [Pleurodeles waltl]|uniref:Uncharacterized protein n=1 Tax=Pleurodeles waltl TaxID=8319 RepID=A0AAV7NWG3_PLEWA|nr:hypothetical protein NDU88_005855 [Pleurodeles waltl]